MKAASGAMSGLANLLGYQLVWLVAVLEAARGRGWPALAALAVFATGQLARSRMRACDLKLLGCALILGIALDGALAAAGLVRYATPAPALPAGGAPLWILALWGAFAGPLAYAAAARLGAVRIGIPHGRAVAGLALGWALAVPALAAAAAHWSPRVASAGEVSA